MTMTPQVNLLLTGQIRDADIFEKIITHLNEHRSAFARCAFVTWTQEIDYNIELLDNARNKIEVIDAGNLIPVTPLMNRDIISLFAQIRQVTCGAEYFNDGAPILRVRADDQSICKLDLTSIIRFIREYWTLNGSRTIVKGAAIDVPAFLDDRLYILSQFHISRLRKLSFCDFLAFHQNNMFPEFLLYYPLFSKFSDNLDNLLATDVRSIRHFGSDFCDIDRWLSREQVANGLEDYCDALKNRVGFFNDIIPQHFHDSTGLSSYLSNVKNELGPTDLSSTREAMYNLAEKCLANQSSVAKEKSRTDYERLENKKTYLEQQFYKQNHEQVVKFFELAENEFMQYINILKIAGVSYFHTGNKEKSHAILKNIFERGARDFRLLFYLSAVSVDLKCEESLVLALEEISRLHLDSFQAADHVVNCLQHIKNIDSASSLFRKVITKWPNETSFHDKFATITKAAYI